MFKKTYSRLEEFQNGEECQVDGDFTCVKAWSTVTIQHDVEGKPFFECKSGSHYLEGQLNEDGLVVGLYRKEDAL